MIELTLRDNVEKYIANNIDVLEDRLEDIAERYLTLKEQKDSFDYGEKLTKKNLDVILRPATIAAKKVLGIEEKFPVGVHIFDLKKTSVYGLKVGGAIFGIGMVVRLFDGFQTSDIWYSLLIAGGITAVGILRQFQDDGRPIFHSDRNTITLSGTNTVEGYAVLAHEFVHRIQESKTDLSSRLEKPGPKYVKKVINWFYNLKHIMKPIAEGHARGVQLKVCEEYFEETGNPTNLFYSLDQTAPEMRHAYERVCKKYDISKKEIPGVDQIPKIKGIRHKLERYHYCIGTAAMQIAEAKHGTKVYRDVLKKDYSFLKI